MTKGGLFKLLKKIKMQDMSYKKAVFFAEEMGREIARNISLQNNISPQNIQTPEVIKTEEIRPTTASIVNHYLNNANNWYEIKIPRDVITWQIKARGNYELRYSYSPTHQNYMTLTKGDVLSADTSPNKDINAIYVMCEDAGVVAELEIWRK